ncbi:NAD-dependent epimerase/dehydratase family protein [Glycomyces artemisiae]|uniref:UDP-glucose 4-epimerase n=1 Tax=Glycomyces artemisiae TaxID=1076443 RepID=A0A2T0UX84_9ACTN|nr:NAD(P)-dependent oxidoreductase [Glycomyces artemisiae]PRY62545.1 UDP-glucose 4-epimerase [Glycomyces artemisiae]
MRIAVTGASGRVGGAVAARLVDNGHTVIGLDLVAPRQAVPGVDYLIGDLADLEPSDPRLAEVEAVAHLGALMSWDEADAARLHHANVTATLNLVRALDGGAVRRFVLASTGEVYPENAPQYQPLDEAHPRLPRTWYGLSKVLAEETVAFAARTRGWDAVALRFSHTQHPAELLDPDSFFSGPRFFASRRHRKALAAGDHALAEQLAPYAGDDGTLLVARRSDGAPVRMGILATDDLARGVVLAVEADTTGYEVAGLGPDDSTDLGDFARDLAEAAGLDTVEVTLPPTAPGYVTSNTRARELFGFTPRITRDDMVRLAAEAHRERTAAG